MSSLKKSMVSLLESRAPSVSNGKTYYISYGAYGVAAEAKVTWWKGSKLNAYSEEGTPKVIFELTIDSWGHEEFDGDLDAEDEILHALAKKLKLIPKKLWWHDPSWQPKSGGNWTRRVSYSGPIVSK